MPLIRLMNNPQYLLRDITAVAGGSRMKHRRSDSLSPEPQRLARYDRKAAP
jgi:hypothetical protein